MWFGCDLTAGCLHPALSLQREHSKSHPKHRGIYPGLGPTPHALRPQGAHLKKEDWSTDEKQPAGCGESGRMWRTSQYQSLELNRPPILGRFFYFHRDGKTAEHTEPTTEVIYGQKQSLSALSVTQCEGWFLKLKPSCHPFMVPHRAPQPTRAQKKKAHLMPSSQVTNS